MKMNILKLIQKSTVTYTIAILLIILASPNYLSAQDGHYWTEQYGNKSLLLSGSVIGNVSDLGAVYYNPGRLGLIKKPAFLINASLYQLTFLKFEDGLGEDIDLSKSSFGEGPSLVAGSFNLNFLKNHRFSYSVLTRNGFSFDSFFRTDSEGEIVENMPGEEVFFGQADLNSKLNDLWLGLTWAFPVAPKSSIGITMFASYKTDEKFFDMRLQAISKDTNVVAILNSSRDINYNAYGLLWKLGYAADISENVSFGLTVTTPKVILGGSGEFITQEFLTGIDTTGDGNNDNVFIANAQESLSVKQKSPWSFGAGFGFDFGNLTLSISGEWFSAISKYTIIQTDPFIGQSSGDTITNSLTDELNSVFNYGLGLEYGFQNNLSIYLSFASDYSGVPDEVSRFLAFGSETSNSTLRADIFHFGGGAVFEFKQMEFTIGTVYARAKEVAKRVINIPSDEEGVTDTVNKTSTIKLNQWRFIVGFSLPFGKEENN
jgi:hypothetical protein